ncbi:hypothetical protein ACWELV_40380 [Streptomyces mirabilis]
MLEKSYGKAGGKPQECLDWRFVPSPVVGSRMDHDEGVEGSETKAAWAQRICVATDEQCAGLFPARGKRAWSPGWQALVMLHFVENLTDRPTDRPTGRPARRCGAGPDRLEIRRRAGLTDPEFDYAVLCEFRDRLIGAEGGREVLDQRLVQSAAMGSAKSQTPALSPMQASCAMSGGTSGALVEAEGAQQPALADARGTPCLVPRMWGQGSERRCGWGAVELLLGQSGQWLGAIAEAGSEAGLTIRLSDGTGLH